MRLPHVHQVHVVVREEMDRLLGGDAVYRHVGGCIIGPARLLPRICVGRPSGLDCAPPMSRPPQDRFPPQIRYLAWNEGCERFSFYGMTSILTIYMVTFLGVREPDA